VSFVLIHKVIPDQAALTIETSKSRPAACEYDLRKKNWFMHRTYIGVAIQLHRAYPLLVSLKALAFICESALEEFDLGRRMYTEFEKPGWAKAEEDFAQDIEEARQILEKQGISLPPYKSRQELQVEDTVSLSSVQKYVRESCLSTHLVRAANIKTEAMGDLTDGGPTQEGPECGNGTHGKLIQQEETSPSDCAPGVEITTL